ncbi:unnamed protein product [Haemonchus placei]|uniref:Uncharacterized protein n=1 Tax=Haemonchus placei TaxID=6290 RepID=A0A0N4WX93_HAEPC|nr:unnamed protein product [Haemonchus placei]
MLCRFVSQAATVSLIGVTRWSSASYRITSAPNAVLWKFVDRERPDTTNGAKLISEIVQLAPPNGGKVSTPPSSRSYPHQIPDNHVLGKPKETIEAAFHQGLNLSPWVVREFNTLTAPKSVGWTPFLFRDLATAFV